MTMRICIALMPLSPLHRQVEKPGRLEEILESREVLIAIECLALIESSSTYKEAVQFVGAQSLPASVVHPSNDNC